jgi:hypothetical protein
MEMNYIGGELVERAPDSDRCPRPEGHRCHGAVRRNPYRAPDGNDSILCSSIAWAARGGDHLNLVIARSQRA